MGLRPKPRASCSRGTKKRKPGAVAKEEASSSPRKHSCCIGFGVEGLGFRCRVYGIGFGVQGLGIQGFRDLGFLEFEV